MRKRVISFNLMFFIFFFTFSLYGCQYESKSVNNDVHAKGDDIKTEDKCRFKILNDKLQSSEGKDLVLGVHLMESLANLSEEYKLSRSSVNNWGYSGGNQGTLVSLEDEEFFVIIPSYSDTVLAYVIVSDKICLKGDITVGSTVDELEKEFGSLEYELNLMTGNEICRIPNSNIQIVFKTTEGDRIGEYEDVESTSKSVNKDFKIDHIVLSI